MWSYRQFLPLIHLIPAHTRRSIQICFFSHFRAQLTHNEGLVWCISWWWWTHIVFIFESYIRHWRRFNYSRLCPIRNIVHCIFSHISRCTKAGKCQSQLVHCETPTKCISLRSQTVDPLPHTKNTATPLTCKCFINSNESITKTTLLLTRCNRGDLIATSDVEKVSHFFYLFCSFCLLVNFRLVNNKISRTKLHSKHSWVLHLAHLLRSRFLFG